MKKSKGIILLAIMQITTGLLLFITGLEGLITRHKVLQASFFLLLGALGFIGGIGLLKLKEWARKLSVICVPFILANFSFFLWTLILIRLSVYFSHLVTDRTLRFIYIFCNYSGPVIRRDISNKIRFSKFF